MLGINNTLFTYETHCLIVAGQPIVYSKDKMWLSYLSHTYWSMLVPNVVYKPIDTTTN